MGFWHTGYGDFHQPTGLDDDVYIPPPPLRYFCEHCSASFSGLDELRRHRFEKHPLRQPALLVRGRSVGSVPLAIVTPLKATDVAVEDATLCVINGRQVTPSGLSVCLASMTHEFVELELHNEGTKICCRLDFRIADEEHLAGVEAAFLRMARDRTLNLDATARFIQDCSGFTSATPYVNGICRYLTGVMAKERSQDSGLPMDKYIECYLQASDELAGYDRPIAQSVRALVAFHFNHFEDAESLAAEGALRHASGAFAGLLQGLPWHFEAAFSPLPGNAVEHLLTEQDTQQILASASHGLIELKSHTTELWLALKRTPAGHDRLKQLLLTSEAFSALDDAASQKTAISLVRELAAHTETRAWAETMLKRLKTQ